MGERKIGVDTRNVGRPSQFNGKDSTWRDWSVVFRSHAALVQCGTDGRDAARGAAADGRNQCGSSRNAGSAEGLRAWQLVVERYDPQIRAITAGQFLGLLQFDFFGDTLAKLEAQERESGAARASLQMAGVWALF